MENTIIKDVLDCINQGGENNHHTNERIIDWLKECIGCKKKM